MPPGFVDDLPREDQEAPLAVIGKRISFNWFDEDGRAELEFIDRQGVDHTIWVDPPFIDSKE